MLTIILLYLVPAIIIAAWLYWDLRYDGHYAEWWCPILMAVFWPVWVMLALIFFVKPRH